MKMSSTTEMIVLILAIAMVVPLPLDEIVGFWVRVALVPIGFILIIRWIIKNDKGSIDLLSADLLIAVQRR